MEDDMVDDRNVVPNGILPPGARRVAMIDTPPSVQEPRGVLPPGARRVAMLDAPRTGNTLPAPRNQVQSDVLPSGARRVPTGAPPRTGFPLPFPDNIDEYWNDKTIVTMTDHTPAMHNAVRAACPQAAVFINGMCAVHCFTTWIQANTKDFRDYETNSGPMNIDFEDYKKSPWAPLVPIFCEKMIEKWHSIGEGQIADKWSGFWSETRHTRVEMNCVGFFKGGIPATNNSAESRNKADKVAFKYSKKKTVAFVHRAIRHLTGRSHDDELFCPSLNRDCCDGRFYHECKRAIDEWTEERPTFLNVDFSIKSPHGIPAGSLLVATTSFLSKDLPLIMAESGFDFDGKATTCKSFLRNRSGGYNADYKKILEQSAVAHRNWISRRAEEGSSAGSPSLGTMFSDWSFDELLAASKRFHLMTPIVFETDADTLAVASFLGVLQRCGMRPMDLETLQSKGSEGLMACRCPCYLKNAWCKHAFCFAHIRGIVQFPKYQEPTRLVKGPIVPNAGKSKTGRPKKARRGGARDKNG